MLFFEGAEYLAFSIPPFVNTEEREAQSSDLNRVMTKIPGKYQLLKWYVFNNIFPILFVFNNVFSKNGDISKSKNVTKIYDH